MWLSVAENKDGPRSRSRRLARSSRATPNAVVALDGTSVDGFVPTLWNDASRRETLGTTLPEAVDEVDDDANAGPRLHSRRFASARDSSAAFLLEPPVDLYSLDRGSVAAVAGTEA